MSDLELELVKKELALLRFEQRDRELNPHKYYDLYSWQDEFINCSKPRQYLTAANQVGKSVALMLKAHKLCTDVDFRFKQWGKNQPKMGWYVLPSQGHINDFFYTKWLPEILSKGEAKEKGPYAWTLIKEGNNVKGIRFLATNCILSFVTTGSRATNLQGRSLGFVIFDEEPPVSMLAEIEMRTASFNDEITGKSTAILAFAFTPTSGQDYFKKIFCFNDRSFLRFIPDDLKAIYFFDKELNEYRTCSVKQEEDELYPISDQVYKRRVSTFEAITFKSGRAGKYTEARIRELIKMQPSKRDALIRVFAAFEKDDNGGLLYPNFNRDKHIKIVTNPNIYQSAQGIFTAGIDYGSGTNHTSAIAITHINPTCNRATVIKLWRGTMGIRTTADDVVKKYIEMSAGLNIDFPFYDWAAADLDTVYWRMTGKNLIQAQKSHEIGQNLIDTLYKNDLLEIIARKGDPYIEWLANEYENLTADQKKNHRTDDLSDAIRYSLAGVAHLFNLEELSPDFKNKVNAEKITKKKEIPEDYGVRSWKNVKEKEINSDDWIEKEIDEWANLF